jgi:hypothetical protein
MNEKYEAPPPTSPRARVDGLFFDSETFLNYKPRWACNLIRTNESEWIPMWRMNVTHEQQS